MYTRLMTNNLRDIEKHAKALMTAHGVGFVQFKFDNARRRVGQCTYVWAWNQDSKRVAVPQTISLSRHYALILPLKELETTILHEIAHALTPGDRHGPRWKAKARELGIKGDRCATPSAKPTPTVVGTCPCGEVVAEQQRLPLRVYWHEQSKCPLPDRALVVWKRKGQTVYENSMPERFRQELRSLRSRGIVSV